MALISLRAGLLAGVIGALLLTVSAFRPAGPPPSGRQRARSRLD